MSKFNEDSRVKIPALLHLTRLGYTYLSLKNAHWDERNNIFPELFEDAVLRINPELRREDVPALRDELHLKLKGDDIGRSFHQRLAVLLPVSDIVERYGSIVEPFMQKMRRGLIENRELTQLRDWLLPLLMNGQVRVK